MEGSTAKNVIIIGLGGYSANLVDIMHDINAANGYELYSPLGYLDDEPSRQGMMYYDLPVLGTLDDASKFPDANFVNAIGSSKTAAKKPELLARTGMPPDRFVTLCHPSAYISKSAKLGLGSVVAQQCVVMSNAVIGDHVKMLPLSTVSYGSTIGDYATIAGGVVIAAEVKVGKCSYLGANCAVRERMVIGDNVIVGMGAMVVDDIANGVTVVGVPARPRS